MPRIYTNPQAQGGQYQPVDGPRDNKAANPVEETKNTGEKDKKRNSGSK